NDIAVPDEERTDIAQRTGDRILFAAVVVHDRRKRTRPRRAPQIGLELALLARQKKLLRVALCQGRPDYKRKGEDPKATYHGLRRVPYSPRVRGDYFSRNPECCSAQRGGKGGA